MDSNHIKTEQDYNKIILELLKLNQNKVIGWHTEKLR